MAYLDEAVVSIVNNASTENHYLLITNTASGIDKLKTSTNISYNPSTNTFVIGGNLDVRGTTTTIGTQDLVVADKNIVLGNVASPSDVTADGGGITLKGTTDKTFNWVDSTDSWTSSENIALASGKVFRINGTNILSSTNAYVTANYSLDGDKLDGQHGSYYLNASNFTNKDPNYSSIQIDNTDTEFVWVSADSTSVSPSTSSDTLKFVGGSGTNFAIDATNKAIRVSHSDTSSQASVNNSGRTYIQDVTLDGFGHVTGLVSATETVTDTTYVFNAATNNSAPALQVVNSGGTIQSVRLIQAGATTITQTNASAITISSANTTYTNSGTGLTLTGTTFAHADTSSVANVNVASRTYITGLTFDEFGHVSGTSTGSETVVDTNTTYNLTTESGGFNNGWIRLDGSDSSMDHVQITGSGGTTIAIGTNSVTISSTVVNDGSLELTATSGSSGTAIAIGTGTGFTANEPTGTITYDIDVGPALPALATIMNGATTGALRKSGNDTFYLDSAVLNSASTLDASKLSGTIPSAVLGNSNVYIGNTSVALNRSTGVLSLAGVNIDGSAGYATSAGSTTYALSAGNGLTGGDFKGNAATTFNVVSAGGVAGSVGILTVGANDLGVTLGTNAVTAAAGNHIHGNITTGGAIGSVAGNVAITGASGVLTALVQGTTSQYLRGDGTWGTPPNTDTLQSITNTATGNYFISFVSADTGNLGGYVRADDLKYNAATKTLSAETFSGSFTGTIKNGVASVSTVTYSATTSNPIILADANSTPITINLPASSSSSGVVFRVKKTDASANLVTIDPNASETIDGAATFVLSFQYQAIDIACDGSNWFIL